MVPDFRPFEGTGAGTTTQDSTELEFSPMSAAELNPNAFDRMAAEAQRKPDRIIWTLGGIAKRIGVGTDFVRDTLAKQPGTPVKEMGGRYYAFEDDLIAYLRR